MSDGTGRGVDVEEHGLEVVVIWQDGPTGVDDLGSRTRARAGAGRVSVGLHVEGRDAEVRGAEKRKEVSRVSEVRVSFGWDFQCTGGCWKIRSGTDQQQATQSPSYRSHVACRISQHEEHNGAQGDHESLHTKVDCIIARYDPKLPQGKPVGLRLFFLSHLSQRYPSVGLAALAVRQVGLGKVGRHVLPVPPEMDLLAHFFNLLHLVRSQLAQLFSRHELGEVFLFRAGRDDHHAPRDKVLHERLDLVDGLARLAGQLLGDLGEHRFERTAGLVPKEGRQSAVGLGDDAVFLV